MDSRSPRHADRRQSNWMRVRFGYRVLIEDWTEQNRASIVRRPISFIDHDSL